MAGGEPLGAYLDAIMRDIETSYPILTDALPKTYSRFEPDLLQRLVRVFNRSALTHASGDVFGKIYEYFLNKFAMSGAQEGGEFFTPPSLVKTIVNFIEPDHGVIFDPACGSAGMFIQTTHFLEDHHLSNTKIRFAGQEKSENNKHLAVMNMVVHGLDATGIKQGNTFYERREELVGLCDFVMANPPFNVDAVDATRCQVDVVSLPTPSKEQPNIPMPTALDYMQAAVTEKNAYPLVCAVSLNAKVPLMNVPMVVLTKTMSFLMPTVYGFNIFIATLMQRVVRVLLWLRVPPMQVAETERFVSN